jgi:hypothetical protein
MPPVVRAMLHIARDVECRGGSGDGPVYTGTVLVIGPMSTTWTARETVSDASSLSRRALHGS